MAMYDHVWLCRLWSVMYGYVRLCRAMYGHLGLRKAM